MKGKTRKLLATLMTLAMVFSLFAGLPLTASAAAGDYDTGDIAVINAIITTNGLGWTAANPDGSESPADWTGVTWDTSTPKRIEGLDISGGIPNGALDVTGLTALEYLNCNYNSLTSLNVTGLTALKYLYCGENSLTSLNVSGLTALEELYCGNNSLTSLNVSALTALKELGCDSNNLTSLNVSGLTALYYLGCENNNLTSLNVSGLTALEYLYCYSNSLTSLNVSGLTALEYLNCYDNSLTSLNVSGLTALEELYCNNNSLTSLNVSGLTALEGLYCYNNNLTSLNVSGLTALEYLDCYENSLTSLNVSGLNALEHLDCSYNSLTSLTLSGLTALEYLGCNNNSLTSLDVTDCVALTELNCSGNFIDSLTGLPVTLGELNCKQNRLTGFDVTGLDDLVYLYCGYNYIDDDELTSPGTYITGVEAITNFPTSGWDYGDFYFSPQHAPGFIAALKVIGLPGTVVAGKTLTLTGTVFPSDATNNTITDWVLYDDGGTGSTLSGNVLTAGTTTGWLDMSAVVENGYATGEDLEYWFVIEVVAETGGGGGGGSSSGGSVTTYTVSFNTNGGSPVASSSVNANGKLTKPADPTREGFDFAGWYTDSALTNAYDFDKAVTGGLTLYAKWTEKAKEPEPITPTMPVNPFSDVKGTDWFIDDVIYAYSKGLIEGTTPTTFAPKSNLTYAQAVTLAARMHQLYTKGEVTLENGDDPWYQPYVDYAIENGIISGDLDWNAMATRAGYMQIFANALPDDAFANINNVPDGSIPDVPMDYPGAAAIYKLYRAGILQGNDAAHSCLPNSNIRRSEVAAILTRMMNPEARISFSM